MQAFKSFLELFAQYLGVPLKVAGFVHQWIFSPWFLPRCTTSFIWSKENNNLAI